MYTYEDVLAYVEEEGVKFIRLAFCDVKGVQKNISIMPGELKKAFTEGIPFEPSNIDGFDSYLSTDLLLHPDPTTLSILPWRPTDGRVVRMYCNVTYPDGRPFEKDSRHILQTAMKAAKDAGIECCFGAESEFYLFKTDEAGEPTKEPFDKAGYLDIAPEDKGENVRREICFTLLDMGITPVSSHHEAGPGQHEIDFKYSDPLTAAEDATTFKSVVKTIAMRNGLYADFSPKPLPDYSGNGMHINISVTKSDGTECLSSFMAGILLHIEELTAFLNPTENSYRRFGEKRAPIYISWSTENRCQLIRIPDTKGEHKRIKLRSPDSGANPYIAFALLIYAGLDGINKDLQPEAPVNADLPNSSGLKKLPLSLKAAKEIAKNSDFLKQSIGEGFLDLI